MYFTTESITKLKLKENFWLIYITEQNRKISKEAYFAIFCMFFSFEFKKVSKELIA